MLGIPTNALAVYVSRGKIVLSGDYVDDSIPHNLAWLNKQKIKRGLIDDRKDHRSPDRPNVERPVYKTSDPNVGAANNARFPRIVDPLDQLRGEKLVEETELLKIRKEKLKAQLLPIEIIKPLFIQFSKSITTAFHNELETMLIEVSHKSGMSNEQMSEMRHRFVQVINQGIDEGIAMTNQGLKNIIAEYSEKRGVGQSEA